MKLRNHKARTMDQMCPVCGTSVFELAEGFDYCVECQRQSQVSQERLANEDEIHHQLKLPFAKRKECFKEQGNRSIYNRFGLRNPQKRGIEENEDSDTSAVSVSEISPARTTNEIRRITGNILPLEAKGKSQPEASTSACSVSAGVKKPSKRQQQLNEGDTLLPKKFRKTLDELVEVKGIVATKHGREIDRILTSTKTLKRLGGIVREMLGLKETFLVRIQQLWLEYVSKFDVPTKSFSSCQWKKLRKVALTRNSVVITVGVWLSLLFIGACEEGADILFSDLIRWMREGRLEIADEEIKFTFSHTVERNNARIKFFDPSQAEALGFTARYLQYVCSLIRVPKTPVLHNFDRIAARMLWNLNLPCALFKQIYYLKTLVPPDCNLDTWRTKESATPTRQRGQKLPPKKPLAGEGPKTPPQLTIETKVLAYVLLSLKLMFGLDGSSERIVSESASRANDEHRLDRQNCSSFEHKEEAFVWEQWVAQSRMRLAAMRGEKMEDILNGQWVDYTETTQDQILRCKRRLITAEKAVCSTGNSGMSTFFYDSKVMKLNEFFVPNPHLKFTGKVSLCSPLSFQAVRYANWNLPGNNRKLNERNKSTFFENFTNVGFEFANPELSSDLKRKLTQSELGSCVMNRNPFENERTKEMFPCAHNYQLYPQVQTFELKDTRSSKPGTKNLFGTYLKRVDFEYLTDYCFSESFQYVLNLLAISIGEDPGLLYWTFQSLQELVLKVNGSTAFEHDVEFLTDEQHVYQRPQ